jgi:hypothetical protein
MYQLKGTSNDSTGALYACAASLRDASARTVGAHVARRDGTPVAFYCEADRVVRATRQASESERATINDMPVLA